MFKNPHGKKIHELECDDMVIDQRPMRNYLIGNQLTLQYLVENRAKDVLCTWLQNCAASHHILNQHTHFLRQFDRLTRKATSQIARKKNRREFYKWALRRQLFQMQELDRQKALKGKKKKNTGPSLELTGAYATVEKNLHLYAFMLM